MKNIFSMLCLISVMWMSCSTTKTTMVNKKAIDVDWIVGIWKHKDKEMYEKWIKLSETDYKGISYNMDAGYATITESMRIFKQGKEDWFFEAMVGENKNAPILFKWMPDPVITLKFVNELHDFPQIVQYRREAFDIMSASISNMAGDKRMVYDYSRYMTQ